MADDEAMLESAVEGVASLRFYTWDEATVSLGYFQPAASREGKLEELPWVRRATGGAAIVHDHELTYALALPEGKAWQGNESWVCRFHHIVQRVLEDHGVASHAVECGEEQKLGPVVCFLHQTPGDLLVNGSKVCGSAQRKMKGALLQHGSILLNRSEFAPELSGINDAAGQELFTPKALASYLVDRLAEETGWQVERDEWTDHERFRAGLIWSEKYSNSEWNEKR
jgi:lipoate-protein ligase A